MAGVMAGVIGVAGVAGVKGVTGVAEYGDWLDCGMVGEGVVDSMVDGMG